MPSPSPSAPALLRDHDDDDYDDRGVVNHRDDPIRRFVSVQRELLRLELNEEEREDDETRVDDDDERRGEAGVLRDLRVGDVTVGLCGRTVLDLVPRRQRHGGAPARPRSADPDVSTAKTDDSTGADMGKEKERTSSADAGDTVVRLPAHRFTVGDEVEIAGRRRHADAGDAGGGGDGGVRATMRGVVSAVTEGCVSIVPSSGPGGRSRRRDGGGTGGGQGRGGGGGKKKSNRNKTSSSSFDEDDDDTTLPFDADGPLTVVRRSSGEVHRRLMRNLDALEKSGVDHPLAGNVVRRMFYNDSGTGVTTSTTTTTTDGGGGGAVDGDGGGLRDDESWTMAPFNPSLDESQLEAVKFALSSDDVALIHGPPGTGKTTAVVELILQAVHRRKWRVLVCAPSNVAVDNVLERLVTFPTGGGAGDVGGGGVDGARRGASSAPPVPVTKVVRLGHPARLNPTVLRHSLEERVRTSDGSALVADARRELEGHVRLLASASSSSRRGGTFSDAASSSSSGKRKGGGKSSSSSSSSSRVKRGVTYADRRLARSEIRLLRREIRDREERVVRDVISGVDVVFATNVGAASHVLESVAPSGGGGSGGRGGGGEGNGGGGFDLVVIDEAAQALEASCWIPILRGRRVVLAGDHRQLPPTVRSREASRRGLGVTMFDRAVAIGGDDDGGGISRMLNVQYRMNRDISDWSSKAMYGGRLRPAASVATRKLVDLPHVVVNADGAANSGSDGDDGRLGTLLLIDTAGCDMEEETTGSGSRFNRGEAEVVKVHVESLLAAGLRQSEIAIITPYNGQVDALRSLLLPNHPNLEIRSVDGFQGGEREAVVLSLVRSNRLGNVGFLGDERRINVAVTRARRHCAVVCDVDTVSRNDFLRGLVTWMGERGDHRSAMEFVDLGTGLAIGEAGEDVVARLTEEATGAAAAEVEDTREETTRAVPPRPGKDAGGSTVVCEGDESSSIKGSGDEESTVAHPPPFVRTVGPHGRNDPHNRSQSREEKRHALMDQIGSFAEDGVRGDELALSDTLSEFERLVVHELAEELGLEHRSEGDGGSRHIVLSIVRGRKPPIQEKSDEPEIGGRTDTDILEKDAKDGEASRGTSVSVFSALGADDSDDSSTLGHEEDRSRANETSGGGGVDMNGMLHDLALERMDGRRQKPSQKTNGRSRKKKKKKKTKSKGNGPEGSNARRAANVIDADVGDGDDRDPDDDDMAFLEAQIKRVQTSHGRKIEGTGSGYRSVINGIIISKPKPPEKKRDPIASSLIREKLRKAEEDRKSKKGNRKRR